MSFWTPEQHKNYKERLAREKYEREHFYSVGQENKKIQDAIDKMRAESEKKKLQDEINKAEAAEEKKLVEEWAKLRKENI